MTYILSVYAAILALAVWQENHAVKQLKDSDGRC
jgi:hypothetical protein